MREWTITHHGKKQGSDTDTQADINAWYVVLLAMKQEQQSVAGLPEEVAALARSMWLKANAAAAEALVEQRLAVDAELAIERQRSATAESSTSAALARATEVGHELNITRESIRRLEESLLAQGAAMLASDARHATYLQARDEIIASLLREGAHKDAEHARRVTELDGLRRHALLQIDDARAESRHWKAESDRLTATHERAFAAERKMLAQAQADLAGALGRLSAIEENLAAAERRSATLDAALAQARLPQPVDTRAAGGTRAGNAVRAPRATAFRRRKIEDLR
ncbi:MAG: hypothetical protein NVSMB6_24280 [Burkholderiaceae bacterium]